MAEGVHSEEGMHLYQNSLSALSTLNFSFWNKDMLQTLLAKKPTSFISDALGLLLFTGE